MYVIKYIVSVLVLTFHLLLFFKKVFVILVKGLRFPVSPLTLGRNERHFLYCFIKNVILHDREPEKGETWDTTTSAHRTIDLFNTGKYGAGKYVQNDPGEEITVCLTKLEETTPPQIT